MECFLWWTRGEFEPHLDFPGDVCILCSARGDGVRLRRFFLASSIIIIPSCPPSSWQRNCKVPMQGNTLCINIFVFMGCRITFTLKWTCRFHSALGECGEDLCGSVLPATLRERSAIHCDISYHRHQLMIP